MSIVTTLVRVYCDTCSTLVATVSRNLLLTNLLSEEKPKGAHPEPFKTVGRSVHNDVDMKHLDEITTSMTTLRCRVCDVDVEVDVGELRRWAHTAAVSNKMRKVQAHRAP